ncbi:hypothetical protein N0V90_005684 [Kalmusia sp. IMI 367209]|nr:hypothetical protein N0V90_005684 [Kalmusia sp. IMI 367209]
MSELIPGMTKADLVLPGSFISTRVVDDVLIGEDVARPLLEASSSGDDATLQSLLSQPKWIKIMLDFPPIIYKESRPREGPDDARKVSARAIGNVDRAFRLAVQNRHAAVLSTLMAFSNRQGVLRSEFIAKATMNKMIANEYAWVWEALASADPEIVHFHCHHGALALYEAVRLKQTYVVEVLLKYGADPLHPVQQPKRLSTYDSSLMSRAAMSQYPRMIEMLLEHGAPIACTAALHTAAAFGRLDTMRVLIQHGADLNEVDHEWNEWTPMHFAASRCQDKAMELLEQSGARSDVKDYEDRTPAQLLKEMILLNARTNQ